MKREFAMLKALIRDWPRASANPRVASWLFHPRKIQTPQVAEVAMALLLNDGNISRAIADLTWRRPAFPWLSKMMKWVDNARGISC